MPPGKFSRERALIVSPADGRRSTLSTRSMFMEPATTSGFRLGLSASALSLEARCACKTYDKMRSEPCAGWLCLQLVCSYLDSPQHKTGFVET